MPSDSKTHILFVHHRSELGGAPASLSYVIQNLDHDRFEPHVFCPPGPAADLFREVGATVHTGMLSGFTHIWASTYSGRRWLLFARELWRLPGHVTQFSAVLRKQPFALVHLNDSPLIVAAWLAHRRGIPVVWHLRSALPGDAQDRRSRLVRAAVRRLADQAIAINEDVGRIFDVGATVIPNAVDLDRFDPAAGVDRPRLGIDPDRPVVAYFGFLYPSKGFREFIHAAAVLKAQGVAATYLIVGGAVRGESFFRTFLGRVLRLLDLARNYEAEAKQLVTRYELDADIHFVPYTRPIEDLYRAADVVVAPSQGPEVGRSVIEAAAAGVPVIASGTRSGAGIVRPGETGVLVPNWGADVLAEAIADLLGDPVRRAELGTAARRHAELTFDARRNAARVAELYDELLETPARIPILFVHHRPQLGGAPSSLAHLIRQLDDRFEPHIVVPDGPAATLFEEAGAVVHRSVVSIFAHAWDNPYEGLRWILLTRELALLPRHVRDLGQLMRRYRFPIVHLNDSPLLAAACVAHRHRARVVWHLRSSLAGQGQDRRSRTIRSLINQWGDAAIAIDTDVARSFDVNLPMTIVPNSAPLVERDIDPEKARAARGLPLDRVVIGYAGFVRRQKGWPELVRAARLLVDRGLPVHFAIMGGGVRPPNYFRTARGRTFALAGLLTDEESAIRRQVADLGLDDRFTFLPFTRDIAEVYAALDIVTFPNQGAGLGRPVLEAAAAGKPVVASGSPDGAGVLVPGVTGILLERGTPETIADGLARLIEDPELRRRLGAAAAAHARTTFDPKANARLVAAVYDSLLPRHGQRRADPVVVSGDAA